MKFLKNLLKPFSRVDREKERQEAAESFVEIVSDFRKNQVKKNTKYKPKENCEIQGHQFKVGDKVICRSNEPYPLMVGKIIEFWDNQGKWEQTIPVVRNNRTGKKFNVHGIVRPYSQELMDTLRTMKPLEQWNYFVPEEVRYTEEEIKRKEESFEKRKKFLPKKK